MLEILDNRRQSLLSDADFWKFIDENIEKPTEFNGVSFVSSIKFIEKELLPRFPKITLILGLTDNGANSIGKRMRQLTDRTKVAKYSFEHPESEFTKRILDGTLQLFFTKKELIHTKAYLITNGNDFLALTGSMNLTEQALHRNVELLVADYGPKNMPIYDCYSQLLDANRKHATDFINAKQLAGFMKAKDSDQLEVNVYTDTVNLIKSKDDESGDAVIMPPAEVKEFRSKYQSDDQLKALSSTDKISVAQTVKLFGPGGHKKRNYNKIGQELYNLTQVVKRETEKKDDSEKITREEDLFPKPIIYWNHGQLYEAPRIGDNVDLSLITSDLAGDDLQRELQLFCDIVHEYDNYKEIGEGWQACDFICYLFEAPWLWQIRNMYEYSDSSKSREDVPLGIALIGRGRTGKSTLGKRLAAKLTGSKNFLDAGVFDPRSYALGKSNTNMTMTTVLKNYMYSDGPVSPMMIDDVSPNLTTRNYFDKFIKDVSNGRNLTQPIIFTMNRQEGDSQSQFSIKPEMMRRLWYLSFESTFSGEDNKREAVLNDLLSRANDQLFRYCQVELAKFFSNVSDRTEAKIENDFLYPVKHILKQAMDQFAMYEQVADYFADNYDYSLFVGRNDWTMLVNQAQVGTDIDFIQQDGRLCAQINKQLFNKVSDNTSKNNGSMMMQRYYQYLPRKYHISYQYTSTGFIVDVTNFDKWLDSDTLRQRYESSQAAQTAREQDNQERLTEAITKLTEATQQKQKKRGIFGWLRR